MQKTKKPYQAPKLRTYGDVRQVTRSAQKNQRDDGGPKNFKT
jgi:hypothetical protein